MNEEAVENYFSRLQGEICNELNILNGEDAFSEELLKTQGGGYSRPKMLENGKEIEKAAVNMTYSIGNNLPPSASSARPQLAGKPFTAVSISIIVHPRNPFIPTTHMNLRFFKIREKDPVWHFGGGYDLTPCYGFTEDAIEWHSFARKATGQYYEEMKKACDEYFYLPHRKEYRGIGGLFFDDWTEGGFDESFHLVQRIGDSFINAYSSIFSRRLGTEYAQEHRDFQLIRRGRYVEFNLVLDRGTRYGLESGRRVESVLSSLPPLASWTTQNRPDTGSPEAELTDFFLKPKDWLNLPANKS